MWKSKFALANTVRFGDFFLVFEENPPIQPFNQ
jgi:hypothetical protein